MKSIYHKTSKEVFAKLASKYARVLTVFEWGKKVCNLTSYMTQHFGKQDFFFNYVRKKYSLFQQPRIPIKCKL